MKHLKKNIAAVSIKILIGLSFVSALHAEPIKGRYQLTRINEIQEYFRNYIFMNSTGMVVGVNGNYSSSPDQIRVKLYRPGIGIRDVTSTYFLPLALNDRGDVVGVRDTDIGDYRIKRELIYVPIDGTENVLKVFPSIETYSNEGIAAAINDDGSIIFGQRNQFEYSENDSQTNQSMLTFFHGTTEVGHVVLPDGNNILGNGDDFPYLGENIPPFLNIADENGALVELGDSDGKASWAKITPSGMVSRYSEAIVPMNSGLKSLGDNRFLSGVGRVRPKGIVKIVDLVNPAVSIANDQIKVPDQAHAVPLAVFDINSHNDRIFSPLFPDDGSNIKTDAIALSSDAIPGGTDGSFFFPGEGRATRPTELACAMKNTSRYLVRNTMQLSESGAILVEATDRKTGSIDLAVLEPSSAGVVLEDNCVLLDVSVVGQCSKYFKKSGVLRRSIPDRTQCKAHVRVRTPQLHPLANQNVITQDDTRGAIKRGKTDGNGELDFSFVGSYAPQSLDIIAPYGGKKYGARLRTIEIK